MRLHFILLIAVFQIFPASGLLVAQSWFKDGLSPEFHSDRRQALRDKMPDNSIAVFFANPKKIRSGSSQFPYRPNADLYYLTGFREANAALIVFKNAFLWQGEEIFEILYVQPRDARAEMWDGVRLGPEGVKENLGISHVFTHDDFLKNPAIDVNSFNTVLAYDLPAVEGGRHNSTLIGMIHAFTSAYNDNLSKPDKALSEIMENLRGEKTEEELVLLRKAIKISGLGHIEAMKSIKLGVSERAIQGVHEFTHKVLGAEAVGYESILAAGNNANILHYVDNSETDLKKGLILMDVGAEYRGYTGDITRTVPISGKFTEEEKAIYNIVLEAELAAIEACKPGGNFMILSKKASDIIDEGLAGLGIIKKGSRHSYFPHGIGHHLGLDVHDKGTRFRLNPGMVITIEPGIYIPVGSDCDPKWWGIGVRIEDNILITETGYENLSEFVPKTIEDIEKLMLQEGILQSID